jgi:hypothetical protein
MLSLSRPLWFHHLSNIWWGVQIMNLLNTHFSLIPHHFVLGPRFLLSTQISKTSNIIIPLKLETKTGKIMFILYLSIVVLSLLHVRRVGNAV